MKRITLLFALITFLPATSFYTFAKDENFWTVRDIPLLLTEKQKTFGIAVAFVDLEQSNVVITLRKINERSIKNSVVDSEALQFIGGKSDSIKLDFSGRTNMVFINLPEGLYQITQVDVPHFDLPYKISTDNSDAWRFNIQRDRINYIGTMKVSAIRSKNTVDTVWLNQFATHLDTLQTFVTESVIPLQIAHGAGYRDPFFAALEGGKNE